MGIHNVVPVVSTGYTLIYNGVDEGVEFAGSIQSIGGATCVGIIAGSLPDADAQGFVINSQTPLQLVVSSSLKLYVKGQSSDTNVILIDNSAFRSTNPAPVTVLNPVPTAIPMIDATSTEFIMQYVTTSGSVVVQFVNLAGNTYIPTAPFQTLEKKISGGIPIFTGGSAVSSSNPLTVAYTSATLTSRSGTIATGGTAQQLMAANASRKGWWLQNLSTGDLWVNRFGGTASAAQPNIQIPSGALYETPAGGAGSTLVSIFGATTGQAFASGEW